jgi:hypothetical protein
MFNRCDVGHNAILDGMERRAARGMGPQVPQAYFRVPDCSLSSLHRSQP